MVFVESGIRILFEEDDRKTSVRWNNPSKGTMSFIIEVHTKEYQKPIFRSSDNVRTEFFRTKEELLVTETRTFLDFFVYKYDLFLFLRTPLSCVYRSISPVVLLR